MFLLHQIPPFQLGVVAFRAGWERVYLCADRKEVTRDRGKEVVVLTTTQHSGSHTASSYHRRSLHDDGLRLCCARLRLSP